MKIDKNWTLFLDRDGVINVRRPNDYVKKWDEFEFLEGSIEAIHKLNKKFSLIVLVTNQRGIGKGLFTHKDLEDVHTNMLIEINKQNGHIDKIYYNAEKEDRAHHRKPNPGMGYLAKKDYPHIDFKKSIIAGDSESDMRFGRNLEMVCVYINTEKRKIDKTLYDYRFDSLLEFSNYLEKEN